MKNILFLGVLLVFLSCGKKETKETKITEGFATYNYESLKPLLEKNDGKTYIINFWATWCKPCVKELPAFEKLNLELEEENIEVVLVSLDFDQTALKLFVEKEKLQSKVVLLDDPDQNSWIPKISEKWTGSIPATLIYTKDKRAFFEQSFTYEELKQTLENFLN
ncbi:TlpA disulfide reductase family protein [uncultured Tenacibaculum sp.]|uniref:TlpA family protein disulfide reductase n=1 Tax=uncultured Tenacibaculum sp. TaxID=174713 RepID=UPI002624475E|nr:TlpA disulfide reductase family protein [uncultured Tenacibaculum sp.]